MAHLSLPPGPFPPGREVVPLEVSLETWGILEYSWVPGRWVFSGSPPPPAPQSGAKSLRVPSVLLPPAPAR